MCDTGISFKTVRHNMRKYVEDHPGTSIADLFAAVPGDSFVQKKRQFLNLIDEGAFVFGFAIWGDERQYFIDRAEWDIEHADFFKTEADFTNHNETYELYPASAQFLLKAIEAAREEAREKLNKTIADEKAKAEKAFAIGMKVAENRQIEKFIAAAKKFGKVFLSEIPDKQDEFVEVMKRIYNSDLQQEILAG